ncbi:hypothetical protein [Marinomonas ostreistagni]|uniref:Elongation factor P n=1 Tax=Marinomonas ostreistagni TaxID=359209 RepID=A0ABS0ZAU7_9GAMM|nr:hypothetical protein [Marinomonas ostreistagni]MBJ7550780.1 hypothetical protein [Marinomonas ostreistagni]
MSEVKTFSQTLYPGKALIVLNGEHNPLFRLAHVSHELTQHGNSYTVEISSVNAGKHRRTRLQGETMQLGQMLIRFEPSTNHPKAAKLVFVEKPSSFHVLPDADLKKAVGM